MRIGLLIGLGMFAACSSEQEGLLAPEVQAGDELVASGVPLRVDTRNDYRCTRDVTGRFENLIVPAGATCLVVDALVRGNVQVGRGASVVVRNSEVRGNVEGVGSRSLDVNGGRVIGNIKVTEGSHPAGSVARIDGGVVVGGDIQIAESFGAWIRVFDAQVDGNIQVVENRTESELDLDGNRVRGNIQVFKNQGQGAQLVRHNWSDQSIQCKENRGSFVGSPNRAGDFEDQCGP